jgi:putative transposase
MIDRSHELALATQARLLGVARSTIYRAPLPVPVSELALMRRIDELHLDYPFAGSRMLRSMLVNEGITIGRTHVRTLMRRMGIEPCTGVRGRANRGPGTGSTRICCVTWG